MDIRPTLRHQPALYLHTAIPVMTHHINLGSFGLHGFRKCLDALTRQPAHWHDLEAGIRYPGLLQLGRLAHIQQNESLFGFKFLRQFLNCNFWNHGLADLSIHLADDDRRIIF